MTKELDALELAELLDRSVLEVSRQAANELRRLSDIEIALEIQGKALRGLQKQNIKLEAEVLRLRAEIIRLKKAVTATVWAYSNLKNKQK